MDSDTRQQQQKRGSNLLPERGSRVSQICRRREKNASGLWQRGATGLSLRVALLLEQVCNSPRRQTVGARRCAERSICSRPLS